MNRTRRLSVLAALTAVVASMLVPTAGATVEAQSVARPLLSSPTTPGFGILSLQADLTQLPEYGYAQEEYFFEGTAQAFDAVGTYAANGVWSVRPSTTAPYKTRMIVRRPVDPRGFNGTVVVEWLNVTAGGDTSPDWQFGRVELMRKGYAWVGISAQYTGVHGPLLGLTSLDPARYGTLAHPGDIYSYDIYSQAGRALKNPLGIDPLHGLRATRKLIADGESQSASRMVTYVNAIAPIARVYNAYLIHSRSASASPLSLAGPGASLPNPAFIRTDISTPVMVVEAETDVPRHAPARQVDSSAFRLWEIAGTSHADLYMLSPAIVSLLGCVLPVNSGPQHYVFHTALRDLRRWMLRRWLVPPSAPLISLDASNTILRDGVGNALGGIRTPQIDVPIATLSGFGNSPGLCSLFGTTDSFTRTELVAKYGTVDQYRYQFFLAEARALESRFILPVDRFSVFAEATSFTFGP